MIQGSLFQAVPSRSAGSRECPECHEPFLPYNRAEGHQRFCSQACRTKAWHREQEAQQGKRHSQRQALLARLKQGPMLRREVKACAGDRFSARVDELRGMGFEILGPVKAPKHGIFKTTQAAPSGEDMYELKDGS